MRTTKELLAGLLDGRWVAQGPRDSTKGSSKEQRKVVYFVFTDKIKGAGQQYRLMADALVDAIEDARRALVTGPSPDQIGRDPSACTVHFSSKAGAKKAAQFLADIYGFWRGNDKGTEDIGSYHVHDKTIRSEIDHVCFFFDPNGFMDFDSKNHRVGEAITIDKDQHQFAKRYLDVLSQISDHGIVADWPYDEADRELIWETHQAKVTLLRLILFSCSDKKPHPDIQKSYRVITFKPDCVDFEIFMGGELLSKLNPAAHRAIVALALQSNLAAIETKDFCNAYDQVWAKAEFGSKNIPKKFAQAMQSLRQIVPELHHEPLGSGRARVYGIELKDKPSISKLKKRLGNIQRRPKE